jgi:glycosyltransferase involved in cell wall biosynthesis
VAELAAVLVAARDEERTITRTVELLHAAFPGVEVIVADDGSRDGTAALAEGPERGSCGCRRAARARL